MEKCRILSVMFMFSFFYSMTGQDKPSTTTWAQSALHVLTFGRLHDRTNVPASIKPVLDEHSKDLQSISSTFNKNTITCRLVQVREFLRDFTRINGRPAGGLNVVQQPWLPGYFIKSDPKRYDNAQEIQRFITQNNLKDSVSVAEKYLYLAPGNKTLNLLTNNYLVVAKNVDGRMYDRCEESKQFKTACERLKPALEKIAEIYGDGHTNNLIFTNDGTKVTIIDTAGGSMHPKRSLTRTAVKTAAVVGVAGGLYYKYFKSGKKVS